jgi:ankyrin repeat protein
MTDEKGWCILHVAAEAGQVDIVQWLTLQVTDLEVETPTGNTPMHIAAMNGHLACMRVGLCPGRILLSLELFIKFTLGFS